MSRLSLRARLTLAFAVAMALVLAATGAFVYVRVGRTLDEGVDGSLRARADDVAALVRRTGSARSGGGTRLAEAEESFAQVIGPDGAVRETTPPLRRGRPLLASGQLARARRSTLVVERGPVPGLEDRRFRLLATPIQAGGERIVVVAGASLDDRQEALDGLATQLLVGGPLALLLASLAGYALAAAALRPVEAMRRRAEAISAATAGSRLPVPDADDEVARLARTLNEMLARLEAGLERERRFVAEASHELRTPLSLLKTELELALRRPRTPDELHAAVAAAAADTDRLVRLANDLLLLASADEGGLRVVPEPVPGRELLETVAGRFEAQARGRAVAVEAPGDLVLDADRLRLEQALGNLVDNAIRHGAGTVRLEAWQLDGAAAIRVSDEGEGFPEAFRPHAFERFSRPDESRAGTGAGLGLALVRAIAEAHGGTASVEGAGGGGAAVVLVLPVSAPRRSRPR